MSTSRLDTSIPDYAINQAVVSGTTWQGPIISLYGAVGFHATGVTTSSAAGTLTIYTSSFDPSLQPNIAYYPPQSGAVGSAIAANATGYVSLTTANGQLNARYAWVAFVPSASGNIYIAVNVRRASA